MFTGIIETVGRLEALDLSATGGRLRVHAGALAGSRAIANSVAVNGCCLTVVALDDATFTADLSLETLHRTSFGEMERGALLNLERPLSAGAELGGHFVQGHVDGVGRITRLDPEGENWWLGVRVPDEIARYVAMKGSIAIDGISLTVAGWHDGIVEIAIIPFTYAQTNLGKAVVGNAVNLECDVLAKYIERLLEAREQTPQSRLTIDRLKAEGF
ncbi:MAG: riboflavin synthase [Candidatus Acidiferrales bacterium]|jgi:riboflavin synthase